MNEIKEIDDISESSIFIQILRWIAVIPGALLAHLILMFPIHWLVIWLHMKDSEGNNGFFALIPEDIMEYGILAFTAPFALIFVGSYIAPKYKLHTGVAMGILWAILFLGSIGFTVGTREVEGWNWLRLTVTVALGIAGAITGFLYTQKYNQKQNSPKT
jgi:hypothetical protein